LIDLSSLSISHILLQSTISFKSAFCLPAVA